MPRPPEPPGDGRPRQKRQLTAKRKRFADLLLTDPRLSVTEAAKQAGFSAKTAAQIGHQLLRDPEVQEYLDVGRAKLAEDLEVSAEAIKADIDRVANLNPKRLFEVKDGITIPKPIDQLTDDEAALIKEIKVTMTPYGPNVNYKMHDRLVARTVQAKMKGLLKDQVEHSGVIDLGGDVRESLLRKLRTVFDAVAAEETPGASSPEPN